MGKIRLELNSAGVRELLKSEEITKACSEAAEKVCAKCGPGYGTNVYTGRNRVNVSVRAETADAYYDNLRNNRILKALG